MLAVEQLERVLDAELVELGCEGLGAEVEEVLVALAGVEVDRGASSGGRRRGAGAMTTGSWSSQRAQTSSVDPAAGRVEGEQRLAGPVGVRRVAGGVAVHLERSAVVAEVERVGLGQVLEEDVVGGLVAVAQRPDRRGDAGRHRELEQRVAGVGGEGREDVGPHHRHDHRPVAARRLAGDPAVVAVGGRRVALVDERHDLVAEVGLVVAGAGRVEELRAAVGGPAVDHDDDRVRALRRWRASRPSAR